MAAELFCVNNFNELNESQSFSKYYSKILLRGKDLMLEPCSSRC